MGDFVEKMLQAVRWVVCAALILSAAIVFFFASVATLGSAFKLIGGGESGDAMLFLAGGLFYLAFSYGLYLLGYACKKTTCKKHLAILNGFLINKHAALIVATMLIVSISIFWYLFV